MKKVNFSYRGTPLSVFATLHQNQTASTDLSALEVVSPTMDSSALFTTLSGASHADRSAGELLSVNLQPLFNLLPVDAAPVQGNEVGTVAEPFHYVFAMQPGWFV